MQELVWGNIMNEHVFKLDTCFCCVQRPGFVVLHEPRWYTRLSGYLGRSRISVFKYSISWSSPPLPSDFWVTKSLLFLFMFLNGYHLYINLCLLHELPSWTELDNWIACLCYWLFHILFSCTKTALTLYLLDSCVTYKDIQLLYELNWQFVFCRNIVASKKRFDPKKILIQKM